VFVSFRGKSLLSARGGWSLIRRQAYDRSLAKRRARSVDYLTMSYVIVQFVEPREVYIDDHPQGSTTAASGKPRALFVGAGTHTFRLGGTPNVDPPTQTLDVPERAILDPFRVDFRKC